MLLSACRPPAFDAFGWKRSVEETQVEQLYAPHFKDGKYFNPWMEMKVGLPDLLRWRFSQGRTYTKAEQDFMPAVIPQVAERIRRFGDGDFILWIGHATFLMRIQGQYWLTDPVFSKRALIPKRLIEAPITAEELNRIAPEMRVIISHNHYDHLDDQSLKELSDQCVFYAPLGLKQHIEKLGKSQVFELDWHQEIAVSPGVTLTALPMQHWSRRLFQAKNETLWASFLIQAESRKVLYVGDSGYFIGFAEIGRRYPGIDYAIIPSTANEPRWFMHYQHMDSAEAIQAFEDLNASCFVASQWGTFALGDEPAGYPGYHLKRIIQERNLDESRFLIMDIGELAPLK